MGLSKSGTILLAGAALLGAAPAADAAGSKLSTAPPSTIPTATQVSAGGTGQPAEATLPRTGTDLPAEALVAMLLLAGGAVARVGSAARSD